MIMCHVTLKHLKKNAVHRTLTEANENLVFHHAKCLHVLTSRYNLQIVNLTRKYQHLEKYIHSIHLKKHNTLQNTRSKTRELVICVVQLKKESNE